VSIFVTWIGEGAEPHGLIGEAIRVLGREYARPAARVSLDTRPADTYDAARRQHASRGVLAWLAAQAAEIESGPGPAKAGRYGDPGPAKAGHYGDPGPAKAGHYGDPGPAKAGRYGDPGPGDTGRYGEADVPEVVVSGFSRTDTSGTRLLGVTDVDLFIPVLTFVFGEAQLGRQAAVVSIARLRDAAIPSLVTGRLAKESVHEIGHTFGLVHCASAACVMARSPGLAAVDRKTDRLCADCRVRYQVLRGHSYVAAHTPHSDR
jgi:archaemetzincin